MRRLLWAMVVTLPLAAQPDQRALSLWKAGRYAEANDAFRALVKQHPKNPDYRVAWGRLYLERFQPADAAQLFEEALALQKDHAGALLGLAEVAASRFDSKAVELAERALRADPKLLPAQELLARLALETNDITEAVAQCEKALSMSPDAWQAMAIRATIDWLDPKGPGVTQDNPWIRRVLSRNPKYGEAFETAGNFFVLNRRYEEGIALYRQALALKPDLWSARAQLGINLMRLGEEKEARAHLEQCWANGYTSTAVKNTLTLMDSYARFVTFRTPATALRLHKKEAELLRPYFQAELDRSIRTFEKKYRVKLERPVQIEVYPDHEDFAVRTMGMPGLGALGVTFGHVVAMDSPSGRKPGTFHWASTLWHEMSHVFVLAATRHKVPRWFTEGLAVHEETAVSPEWGDRLDPHTLAAVKQKKLLPVAELDRGFIRPSYPHQVVVSYFQAGRICDYINRKWGFGKLLEMMHGFGEGASTPEVFEKHLGMPAAEFDKEFLVSLEQELKPLLERFDEWRGKVKTLAELARAGKHDEVIREGVAIRDLYREYVEAGSVYEFLAEAYQAKGEKEKAIEELSRYARAGGRRPDTLKQLARLLEEAGRPQEAAAALARLNLIYPHDEELHQRLGSLYLRTGRPQDAVREFRALLAMQPQDVAGAHFQLAQALRAAGQAGAAKDALISALEAAPGYRPAQKMLLELSRGESDKK